MGDQSDQVELYFGVLVVPNPNNDGGGNYQQVATVPQSMSFRLTDENAQIFYEASKDAGLDVTALVYVPTIDDPGSCGYASLPNNVTHISQLPTRYNNVALAPLTNPSCAQLWMDRAHLDGAHDIIFYGSFTSSNNSSAIPGPDWIGNTNGLTYSVYYIDGDLGEQLVNYLSLYSGNMTGVPYGSELVQYFDFRDYVRVGVEINNPSSSNNVPGLWVFLVIALSILLFAGFASWFVIHFLQYRNRRDLRRRIANGEVDLEALGVKRVTVPRWILDKIPVRVYVPADPANVRDLSEEKDDAPTQKPEVAISQLPDESPNTTTAVTSETLGSDGPSPSTTPLSTSEFSQSTCPICLDDFVPNSTLVRELPCLHIYHLECIDAFLEHQSSLCPLCKQSTLPRGYIPSTLRITNATVRRERRMRRGHGSDGDDDHSRFGRILRLWHRRRDRSRDDRHDEYELQDMSSIRQSMTQTSANASPATTVREHSVEETSDTEAEPYHTQPQLGRPN
ncbi:hypothetical protein V1525DRAFT_404942 [Lipomyces kononenkoae]|uniref:Uncharacterized protein n=1 Tax=Lipomyces kononenkoae TaxID=34357 RepID=A0ACC3T0Q3_LIPKO